MTNSDFHRSAESKSELMERIKARLADLREANETYRKASWDKSSDIHRNEREIHWLNEFRSLLALSDIPAPAQPVAWRVLNDFGHWYITQDKALADTYRDIEKKDVQPLYLAAQPPAAPVEPAGLEAEIRRELTDCQGALDTIAANRKPDNKTQWGNERFYEGRKRSLEFVLDLLPRLSAGNADAIRQQLIGGNRLAKDVGKRRQYYYRMNGCNAAHSQALDCVCWHDEGTGPYADRSDAPVTWRTVNEPQGARK